MPSSPEMGFRPMPEMPADLNAASRKAASVTEKYAIKPEEFIYEDGTNHPMIEANLQYVAGRKAQFDNAGSEEYKLAKSLEAALFDRINGDKWFGERTAMIMASEYDDIANGIDGILEFQEQKGERSYLGMAVDVTYQHDLSKKFDIIKEQIDKCQLGFVKYFRSSDGEKKRPLKNLPRGVVAMNAADATRTVRDWEQEQPDSGERVRAVILRQLELELTAFENYARGLEQADRRRFRVARFYEGARKNVAALLSGIVKIEDLTELDAHPSIKVVLEQLKKFSPEQRGETAAA